LAVVFLDCFILTYSFTIDSRPPPLVVSKYGRPHKREGSMRYRPLGQSKLVGARKPEQSLENAAAADVMLTSTDLTTISEALGSTRGL
jgi:hypothetical protein